MYFLLLLMSSLQQNWRKGQNGFCLKARGGEEREGADGRGENGPNNVCTYEEMNKKIKYKVNLKEPSGTYVHLMNEF
jgi:hypothetical protein